MHKLEGRHFCNCCFTVSVTTIEFHFRRWKETREEAVGYLVGPKEYSMAKQNVFNWSHDFNGPYGIGSMHSWASKDTKFQANSSNFTHLMQELANAIDFVAQFMRWIIKRATIATWCLACLFHLVCTTDWSCTKSLLFLAPIMILTTAHITTEKDQNISHNGNRNGVRYVKPWNCYISLASKNGA